MKEGTVKFFNDSKGYGFVTDNESGTEYFVHVSGLIDEVKEEAGMPVIGVIDPGAHMAVRATRSRSSRSSRSPAAPA